jgi:lysophospholipase L1-like esterase
VAMIEQAQSRGIKVLLLTPTPDLTANLDDPSDPLLQHAAQIRELAAAYQVGLVDSFSAFQEFAAEGGDLPSLMAQKNHPNARGHRLVADALAEWFPEFADSD